MHRWAIPVAIVAGIAIVVAADPGIERFSAALFALGSIGLYVVSATVHYRSWKPIHLHRLFQADHSMIMLFICASTAPVALAGVGGRTGWILFLGMVIGVAIGLIAVWLPFHPPRGFMNTLFFAVGWWPVLFAKSIGDALGAGGVALLIAGGLIYTLGALIVGFQRPDPNPEVFGYHEIWHVLVIVANAVHYVLMWKIVTGQIPF
jgi:hemolysin III